MVEDAGYVPGEFEMLALIFSDWDGCGSDLGNLVSFFEVTMAGYGGVGLEFTCEPRYRQLEEQGRIVIRASS